MRYILFIFVFIAQIANAQIRDFQIKGGTNADSLYILTTDTADVSAKKGLGKWRLRSEVIGSVAGDTDWYKVGGTAIPTNSDSAYRSGYTLLKGLDGGINTKIEMLKNGVINFDKTGLYNTPTFLFSANPMQSGVNVGRIGMVSYASDNTYGAKKNQVLAFGINPIDADNSATGLYFSFEDYYRPSAPSAYSELHLLFNDSTDVDRRLWTWFINKSDPTAWQVAYYTDQLSIRDPRALTADSTYFKIEQVDGVQSQLLLLGANNSVSGGSKGVGQLVHTTNNTFEIYPYGSMPSSSEFYTRQFNVTNVNKLRIETDFGTTNGSSGIGTRIVGAEGSYNGAVFLEDGYGVNISSSNNLEVDTAQVATQYDLTTISAGATDLTITGASSPYTIASSTGTDVNVGQLYGITLSETTPNQLDIKADTSVLATPYDISGFGTMSNWLLATGDTGGTETITNGETVTLTAGTGMDFTRSTNTAFVSLDLDEITTDAAPEGDEYVIGSDGSTVNEKWLISNFDLSTTNEIQDITVTGASQPFTLDLGSDATDATFTGAGITTVTRSFNALTFTSTEVDGSTTNEAWTIDADDADTELISNQTVKFEGHGGIATNYIPLTNTLEIDASGVTGSGDGDGIYDGDGTTPTDVDVTMTDNIRFGTTTDNDLFIDGSNDRVGIGTGSPAYGLHVLSDAGAAVESKTAGTGGLIFKLEGKADGGGANKSQSTISMAYTDADYAGGVEQQGLDMTLYKESDAAQWTTVKMRMTENTDADMIVMEKNEGFANTTESHLAMNAGIAFTQNYDLSTSGDLNLDRSYYTINITGGSLTDTIKLPEVASTADNWTSALTDAQVQVGQEYVISNLRSGVNLIVGAYNPAGTSDDLIGTRTAPGGSAGSAISLAPGKSAIIKCYQLAGGIGYWNYWLSN